jgi:hypothetical protein
MATIDIDLDATCTKCGASGVVNNSGACLKCLAEVVKQKRPDKAKLSRIKAYHSAAESRGSQRRGGRNL